MLRRRLPPFPVEGLIDHPRAMTLPAAAFGMLCRLCLHLWATECHPLPSSQEELRSIARAHGPTWRRWRVEILKIFEDIRPELERYRQWRETRRGVLREVALRGSEAAAANRARERIKKSQPAAAPGGALVAPKRLRREPVARVEDRARFRD